MAQIRVTSTCNREVTGSNPVKGNLVAQWIERYVTLVDYSWFNGEYMKPKLLTRAERKAIKEILSQKALSGSDIYELACYVCPLWHTLQVVEKKYKELRDNLYMDGMN